MTVGACATRSRSRVPGGGGGGGRSGGEAGEVEESKEAVVVTATPFFLGCGAPPGALPLPPLPALAG